MGTVTPFKGLKQAVALMVSDKEKFRKTRLALSPAWKSLRGRVPGWTPQAVRESSCACPRSRLYFVLKQKHVSWADCLPMWFPLS